MAKRCHNRNSRRRSCVPPFLSASAFAMATALPAAATESGPPPAPLMPPDSGGRLLAEMLSLNTPREKPPPERSGRCPNSVVVEPKAYEAGPYEYLSMPWSEPLQRRSLQGPYGITGSASDADTALLCGRRVKTENETETSW